MTGSGAGPAGPRGIPTGPPTARPPGERREDSIVGGPTDAGVVAVRGVPAGFIGPGPVSVGPRMDVDDDLSGAQVEVLVPRVGAALRASSPSVRHAEIAPAG